MRLAPGGRRYALVAGGLAAIGVFVSAWIGLGFLLVSAFVLWFYRDPDRTPPSAGIVAPADGRVTVIREEADRVRVGVFMSPLDVHVNRAPLAGIVTAVEHTPGAHRPAFSKDSERNERVRIELEVGRGVDDRAETGVDDDWSATIVLIAGAFARRITPYVEDGDRVARGERIGHIAFGSRADVVMPADIPSSALQVTEGDRVRAGETVLADWD